MASARPRRRAPRLRSLAKFSVPGYRAKPRRCRGVRGSDRAVPSHRRRHYFAPPGRAPSESLDVWARFRYRSRAAAEPVQAGGLAIRRPALPVPPRGSRPPEPGRRIAPPLRDRVCRMIRRGSASLMVLEAKTAASRVQQRLARAIRVSDPALEVRTPTTPRGCLAVQLIEFTVRPSPTGTASPVLWNPLRSASWRARSRRCRRSPRSAIRVRCILLTAPWVSFRRRGRVVPHGSGRITGVPPGSAAGPDLGRYQFLQALPAARWSSCSRSRSDVPAFPKTVRQPTFPHNTSARPGMPPT